MDSTVYSRVVWCALNFSCPGTQPLIRVRSDIGVSVPSGSHNWCQDSRIGQLICSGGSIAIPGCRARVTDDHPLTVSRYQIRGLPTLLFFKDGKVQDTVVGAAPRGQLAAKLDAVLEQAA